MPQPQLPKCQGLARAQWLEDRQAELLDVPYFHVVFTVPDLIATIAFQNQTVVYDILFRAASETLRTIAADPEHLGAEMASSVCCIPGDRIVAPSTHSFSRSRRRHRTRRAKLDCLPTGVLSAGQGVVADVPGIVPALPGEGVRRR